jgi:transcriptional regulator with XRE-family HTH domain
MTTTEWMTVLEDRCEESSQADVARRLGVSAALVNRVLKGTYPGNLSRIEALVRGTYMQESVVCPVLGTITRRRCLDEQTRPLAITNPQRIALYRACRAGCPHHT